ncbi:universal stress protein [Fibrivirga algicola]|uniref:Universal stress protein n=1 Tax=Fibrivirga algicola TaxID=2950420 RepID=A0ABX0QTG0_9BACT|nr:universal stress protein [Fibrivirga algicola]NID13469.1 universal stress protein [Fibrivirga algicola]
MKKILLLTDLSEASRQALTFARSFFSDTIADFHLLCAYPITPGGRRNPLLVSKLLPSVQADQLNEVVTTLRREATNDWHTFRSSAFPGQLVDLVEQAFAAELYDFVVVGPLPEETGDLFGNSAIELVHRLKANILVVPQELTNQKRPVNQIVLAADFARLKNAKLLGPLKELVILKGAQLTLLTIDTPDKHIIEIEQETHIRQFLKPIQPVIARVKASDARQGINDYLAAHLVDLLVTIPKYNDGTQTLTSGRVTRLQAFAPAVPLLTLYDDNSDDKPRPINEVSVVAAGL